MFSLLHNFYPQPILFNWWLFTIHWYALFVVLGIISALLLILFLAKKFKINSETIWDLSFYLVLFGIIGARVYEIFLELPYYLKHSTQILKIWEGGLAIHGAIITGAICLFIYSKKNKLNFWTMLAIFSPGIALGQAVGRFGNWFNQELFGLPTNLAWGIPIEVINRPLKYINQTYFQPTFLYESFSLLLISVFLTCLLLKQKTSLSNKMAMRISAYYLGLISILRFMLEFIKIDITPQLLGLRWPQIISLLIFIIAVYIYKKSHHV